ncbi:hypothetical protein BJ508DRAFT_27958 [Ascobolus immersus RN42]|uniref:Uncharacterized protein n=1 Tax=Ascobolus immersus RN42 TaxID=1160509 RepID=A0A3N4HP14_ASCIM|nr:hypothetical protein BJ508DRAFT_27958 [Ascobolus immersus RN42]
MIGMRAPDAGGNTGCGVAGREHCGVLEDLRGARFRNHGLEWGLQSIGPRCRSDPVVPPRDIGKKSFAMVRRPATYLYSTNSYRLPLWHLRRTPAELAQPHLSRFFFDRYLTPVSKLAPSSTCPDLDLDMHIDCQKEITSTHGGPRVTDYKRGELALESLESVSLGNKQPVVTMF